MRLSNWVKLRYRTRPSTGCMKNTLSLENILEVAKRASHEGAEVLRSYFGNIRNVQEKHDSSIVSEADRESERVIRSILQSELPQFDIYGEEGGHIVTEEGSQGLWHIDPLDGTTNFVHGFPYFSTSLGLEVKGQIVVAVVDAPLLGLKVWATRSGGAFLNGKKIQVSNRQELKESLLATGFSSESLRDRDNQVAIFSCLLGKSRGVRRAGAAVLDMCYTAMGSFDVFWEKHLKPWDMAAGSLIIEEAGGIVSTIEGEVWTVSSKSVLAGNPKIHALVKKEISHILKK